METKLNTKVEIVVLIISALLISLQVIDAFNVGLRRTACSLDPNDNNNPCQSLYDAVCDGAHCKCPAGTHVDKTSKKCVQGSGSGGGDDDLDLPFDYVPGAKPKPKIKTTTPPPRPSAPTQPHIPPAKPQAPIEDPHLAEKTGGGIGGGVGLLLLLAVAYCCCRGEKGKSLRSKLPFFNKGQSQDNYRMDQQVPGQQPGAPPPAAV